MSVSVCMTTFNGEAFILQQIDSILRQLSGNDELVIVDDCSTDNTVKLLAQIDDPRIKLHVNSSNMGVRRSFNKSLQKSINEIIFLSDQDDIWLDGKVSSCLRVLSEFDLVVTDCIVVNQDLEILHESFFSLSSSGVGVLKNLHKNTYLGCCMAFRRSILDLVLPLPKSLMVHHDTWIGFLGGMYFKNHFLNEQLLYYRRHSSNASPTTDRSTNSLMFKVTSRIQLILFGLSRLINYRFFRSK